MARIRCLVWVDPPPCENCNCTNKKKIAVCPHAAGESGRLCIKYAEGFASAEEFERENLFVPELRPLGT